MERSEAPPAVAVVDRLLRTARERGASDLHLDPGPRGLRVRLRRDGALSTLETLPGALAPQVVGRCKALAQLLVYRSDVPQEGRIDQGRAEGLGAARVATYPTVFGERVAVRFDAAGFATPALDALGYPPAIEQALAAAVTAPDGLLLVTGPSGSGKTTTLYACLDQLVSHGPERTVMTVEDPVERHVDGVVQTEVDPHSGLDFARALRSLLRQDPDVLLVGEVRDAETASAALKAALTGHLVLATLHARTAPEAFARLLDLGCEPFTLSTTVRGVLGQRLVRRRCAEHRPDDCPHCFGSGYAGRLPVAEWLAVGDAMRRAILARADGTALAAAAAEAGHIDLHAAAATLVERGLTDEGEVERVLGRF